MRQRKLPVPLQGISITKHTVLVLATGVTTEEMFIVPIVLYPYGLKSLISSSLLEYLARSFVLVFTARK